MDKPVSLNVVLQKMAKRIAQLENRVSQLEGIVEEMEDEQRNELIGRHERGED
jgi:TolA-binding protein